MHLSLRLRLVIWYSVIVTASLSAFGIWSYISVSREMRDNLDASLQRIAYSLDYVIRDKQASTMKPLRPQRKRRDEVHDQFAFFKERKTTNFIGPVLPDTTSAESVVWSAVYEHILFNSKNILVQIADNKDQIVYLSENMATNTLPVFDHFRLPDQKPSEPKLFSEYRMRGQSLRLLLLKTGTSQISVAYPLEEIETTLKELFSNMLLIAPMILVVSMYGGFFLAKYSLQPVDDIARSAHEITAHNLSRRLPVPEAEDEIRRLTLTLNKMIGRIEAGFDQMKRFTADASHELRTPLAILMGELEVSLRKLRTPYEYEEILNSALVEVERLSKVVESLLELSRAETGQVQMNLRPMNFSNFIDDIVEDAEILAEEKEQGIRQSVDREIMVLADDVRIHQAILNITENAIKYTQRGGVIELSLTVEQDCAVYRVKDNGIGIPAEDLPHLFERFYRADKSRTTLEVTGNGLGLSIAKWIVEAHNGTINVESSVGVGTTFSISIPLLGK